MSIFNFFEQSLNRLGSSPLIAIMPMEKHNLGRHQTNQVQEVRSGHLVLTRRELYVCWTACYTEHWDPLSEPSAGLPHWGKWEKLDAGNFNEMGK